MCMYMYCTWCQFYSVLVGMRERLSSFVTKGRHLDGTWKWPWTPHRLYLSLESLSPCAFHSTIIPGFWLADVKDSRLDQLVSWSILRLLRPLKAAGVMDYGEIVCNIMHMYVHMYTCTVLLICTHTHTHAAVHDHAPSIPFVTTCFGGRGVEETGN